jgi:ferric-dicitrate binding protein FerR (iron transport regulator)
MESEFDYNELMVKCFSGQLNVEEKKKLDEWKNASEENLSIFTKAKEIWYAFDLLQEMKKYNVLKALNKVDSKIKKNTYPRIIYYWQRIAAILLLPLIIATVFYIFQTRNRTSDLVTWQTISTFNGVKSQIQLPDGTIVWLNSGSKLTYPSSFSKKERKVKLTGEAYFDVAKNKRQPFYIDLDQIGIAVTGTTFNVIHYPNEKQTEVVLSSGEVRLFEHENNKLKDIAKMKPGEKAVYETLLHKVNITQTDPDKYTSWINGYLIFRDDVMTDVVKKLSRRFNVNIEIGDQEIAGYIYTATFKDETLDQILYLLKRTSPITYTVIPPKQLKDGSFQSQKIILRKIKQVK